MEIDKIAFICVKGKKVLAAVSKGKDAFYIPGGKREAGEDDKATLIREVEEELSVKILPETIKYYGTFAAQAHGKPSGTTVKMTCYMAGFRGKLKAGAEIGRIVWVTSKDIAVAPPVDKLILEDLKKKNLIS